MANFSSPEIHDLTVVTEELGRELDNWTSSLPRMSVDTYAGGVQAAYDRIKAGIGRNTDAALRWITVPAVTEGLVLVVCLDTIVNTTTVDQDVVAPLMKTQLPADRWDQGAVNPASVSKSSAWPAILKELASGKTLVFAPGVPDAWIIDTAKFPQRSVDRPQTELAVRGSEEGFSETLTTQKGQIRHRLHTPNLIFQDITLGSVQQVTVSVAYIEGITNPALVTTAAERLRAVDVDGVVTSTQISGLIRDHPHSIFPTIRHTERVDMVVWRLMEGAVAIMLDGDPFVLLAPSPLIDFYRTAMDYSSSWVDTSFVRVIRFVGWILGIYLPAVYVALAMVNPSILPTNLFVVMQAASIGLAFPAIVQVVLMILIIETLREAAIRLPKILSTTIGTVGAIVVGTAIVKAGLVNTQIIVMTTLTALSLFSTPVYELASTWRIVNWFMLIIALVLGVVGIVLGTMGVIAVLVDMTSFGTPYFEPWAPFRAADWHDYVIRLPWTMISHRWTGPQPQRYHWRRQQEIVSRPDLKRGRVR